MCDNEQDKHIIFHSNHNDTFAAPVELGIIFCPAPRPPRQSFIEGPSTVFCVAENNENKKVSQDRKFIYIFMYMYINIYIRGKQSTEYAGEEDLWLHAQLSLNPLKCQIPHGQPAKNMKRAHKKMCSFP